MKMALGRPQLISLAAGFTDNETLPVEETRAILEEVLGAGSNGQAALQYGTTLGDSELRELTAKELHERDGAANEASVYSPERLLITNGSQQLLYMLSEALCDPGDIVIVEDPTYFVFLGALQSHGTEIRGVALDTEGIDLEQMRSVLDQLANDGLLPRVKMVVLVSYYQNPTGITTSLERKAGLLRLLREYEPSAGHPIYVVEDAVYRDLCFAGGDTPSALALSVPEVSERVIYVGTYSKPFATGIRVGYGVLPELLMTVVGRIKGNQDFGTANLLQQAMVQAIRTGRYASHVTRIRQRYAEKAETMCRAIREHFPSEIEWRHPRGGLYVWARLPDAVPTGLDSELFQAALDDDVLYVPGELCYAEDPTRAKPNHEMRLSFGAVPQEQIQAGIERLGNVLRRFMD